MTRSAGRSTRASGVPNYVFGIGGAVLMLLVLEILSRTEVLNPSFLPPVTKMFVALGRLLATGGFWSALAHTVLTWVLGLGISFVAGVVLGVLIGTLPWLREFTASTIEFLRPVPSVALIPVAVLLLGTGITSTLLLVVYASFWQVLIQVMAGVQDVDPVASDTARAYRFGRFTRIRTVVWPTTLPFAMTGLRLAASVALILTVTGELLVSGEGLGGDLAAARESGAVVKMYAFVIVAGILGVIVNLLARTVERRTLSWHPSVRMEVNQ